MRIFRKGMKLIIKQKILIHFGIEYLSGKGYNGDYFAKQSAYVLSAAIYLIFRRNCTHKHKAVLDYSPFMPVYVDTFVF